MRKPHGAGWIVASASILEIKLNRGRRLWTLQKQPPRRIRLAYRLWQNPGFRDALQRHVPAVRIDGNALVPATAQALRLFARLSAIALLLLGGAVGLAAMLVLPGATPTALKNFYMLAGVCTAIGFLLAVFRLGWDRSLTGNLLCGLLVAGHFAFKSAFLAVVMYSFPPAIFGAAVGAAGLSLGAGAAFIMGRRRIYWRHLVLPAILGIAGFMAGFEGVGGVPDRLAVEGTLPLTSECPWTPDGQAFIVTTETGLDSSAASAHPILFRWYSAHGQLLRSHRILAHGAAVRAVGAEGALAQAFLPRAEHRDLWFLPRGSGQAEKLISAASSFSDFRTSPGRDFAIVGAWHRETKDWYLVDMRTGAMKPFGLPGDPALIHSPALRADGTILWLTGSPPRVSKEMRVSSGTRIPPNGSFPDPGVPFAIWSWNPVTPNPPRRLYQAETAWCSWLLSPVADYVLACRISQAPAWEWEYVRIDVSGDTPAVSAITRDSFQSPSPPPSSPTLRADLEPWFLNNRICLRDIHTGRTWRTRHSILWDGRMNQDFSPTHKAFLFEVVRIRRDPWKIGWNLDDFLLPQLVVHLVDLEGR